MDKLSEQVRTLVWEWREEGNRDYVAVANRRRCAAILENLLPQIEAMEQREDALIREAFLLCDEKCTEIVESRDPEDAKGIAAANLCGMEIECLNADAVRERLARKEQVK